MNKQIEEMARDMCNACYGVFTTECEERPCWDVRKHAEALYNAGYRKQVEGEWKYNPDGMDWGLGAWECSLCSCRNDNLPMQENIKPLCWAGTKYCPNCGAKMKGGE